MSRPALPAALNDLLIARVSAILRRSWLQKLILATVLIGVILSILAAGLHPERLSLNPGEVSPRDIIAPRSVIDRFQTELLMSQAEESVAKVYQESPTVRQQVQGVIRRIFTAARLARSLPGTGEDLAQRAESLRDQFPLAVDSAVIRTLLKVSDDDLTFIERETTLSVDRALTAGIKEEGFEEARRQLEREIAAMEASPTVREAVSKLASGVLRPNQELDARATQQRRREARDAVEPVYVLKGQKIVGRGDVVSERQIAILNELGLLSNKVDYRLLLGLGGIALLLVAGYSLYLYLFEKELFASTTHLVLLAVVMIVLLGLAQLLVPSYRFMIPAAAGSMIVTILLGARPAVFLAMTLSLALGLLGEGETDLVIVAFLSGITGIFLVSKISGRSDLMRAGVIISLVNAVAITSLGFLYNNPVGEMVAEAGHGLLNGVLSAVLTIGSLPFFESTFRVTSPIKLLELANPNHPLLKRLLLEAPGTYHHSVIVANLAEAAAERVGADPLLARVCSYYHDIGKLKRPYLFIENQVFKDNPHDKLSPTLSTLVVTSHVKDGLELAAEYKLPVRLRNTIPEHHGTSLVSYFYHRAANGKADGVNEDDFRYEGPKPQSKEAAIIMLADVAEAAARALSRPTPGRLEGLVRKVIKERLYDGQLDESEITLKELEQIAVAFSRVLAGIYHPRVEYPERMAQEAAELEKSRSGEGRRVEGAGGSKLPPDGSS
ncbi:MAG: HDIG domain-containing protein [Firmicutes bacterium]|nr:HDIG domain-containing protein [Bacillota bacterium]